MAVYFASAIDDDACTVQCLHLPRTARLCRPLGDPSRTRILHALPMAEEEPCTCDVARVLEMSVSALTHQLRYLRERGAVSRDTVGRIVHDRLIDEHLRRLVVDRVAHVAEVD
jgi:DNA-binding transcriptional ArsR family regulator